MLVSWRQPWAAGPHGTSPLHSAARRRHAPFVAALLAAGADPNVRNGRNRTPLHWAAASGCTACTGSLLAAGATPLAASRSRRTAAHLAAANNQAATLRQLLATDPGVALLRDHRKRTPLQCALEHSAVEAARCLLEAGPQQPAGKLLSTIRRKAQPPEVVPLLYSLVATHMPLAEQEWASIPAPCDALRDALPAVLQRSAAEAGQLVRHLSLGEQDRLVTLAFCLERVHRRRPTRRSYVLPRLPTELVWRIVALAAAG